MGAMFFQLRRHFFAFMPLEFPWPAPEVIGGNSISIGRL